MASHGGPHFFGGGVFVSHLTLGGWSGTLTQPDGTQVTYGVHGEVLAITRPGESPEQGPSIGELQLAARTAEGPING